MPQPDSSRVQKIFSEASSLPPDQRTEFLDRACADDAALRAEVAELLDAKMDAGDFLTAPIADFAKTVHSQGNLAATQVGRYKILEVLGEGGFATVYRAEQMEPVRREVALKIIKLGMDTRQVIARFEAERQVLAILDHPSIAKVFDAGATDTGRLYFVMELVRGQPVTQYCDRRGFSLRQRLELFMPICQAVQHAHQKGIIHRDIKPGNVLVFEQDGNPVPKVIDFGIAKATQSGLTGTTLFTELRQMIGTPTYMSPEQTRLNPTDVDIRSDIYSLGALLYELLTGTTPIGEKELRAAAYGQMQKMIQETEPPPPSTRITSLGESKASAAVPNVDSKELSRSVRGEVDWIVMRCLEKDRARPYQSAGALSDDIGRYLEGDDVLARAPTQAYRIKKFVHRHAIGLGISALLLTVLIAALVTTSVALVRESRARLQAEHANKDALDAIRASIGWVGPDRPTKLLQENYDRVKAAYGDDNTMTITAAFTLASAMAQDNHYADAERILTDTIERARRVCGPHSVQLLAAVEYMMNCLGKQNKFEELLPYARQLFEAVDSDEMDPHMAGYYAPLWGGNLNLLQRYSDARQPLLGALRILRTRCPDSHLNMKSVLIDLAEGAEQLGDAKQAAQWRHEAYVEAKLAAEEVRQPNQPKS